jgi:hypothetical protein
MAADYARLGEILAPKPAAAPAAAKPAAPAPAAPKPAAKGARS